MGIYSLLEERATPPAPHDDFWYTPLTRTPQSGVEVTPDNALWQTAVWDAVWIISSTVGTLPCTTYKEFPGGGKDKAKDSHFYDVFRWKPNQWQTAVEYFEMAQGHLLLRGNHYSQIVLNRGGELEQLVPLHPDRMRLEVTDTTVRYILKLAEGRERTFSAEEILHVKGLTTNGLVGLDCITAGAEALGMAFAAEAYGARFFKNDSKPSGIITHPAKLKEDSRANLKKSWTRSQGGSNQHSVAIFEEGMGWQSIGIAPEQAQFLQTRKFQIEEIARLFHLPPHMLKQLDRATFSNIEQQSLEFAELTIRPWLVLSLIHISEPTRPY